MRNSFILLRPNLLALQARSKSLTTNIRIHTAELVVKPFFKTFDDIVDHCCYAWNTLIDQPWKIMSVARRDWAIASNLRISIST
jgi:hypothetical protein